jgi:hypothetical protein
MWVGGGGLYEGKISYKINQHKLGNVHTVNSTGASALSCNYFKMRNTHRKTVRGIKCGGSVLSAFAKLRKVTIRFLMSNETP